jgi:rod shape-determining protein MreC
MLEFLRRNRVLFASAGFCLLATGLVLSASPSTRDDRLGRFFLELMAPLQGAVAAIRNTVSGAWNSVAGVLDARDQNVVLRGRVDELERDLARLAEVDLENVRLRRFLDYRQTLPGPVLTAQVVGWDPGSARTITIDRGASDGVTKSRGVLTPDGVVGRVIEASGHAARVLLVTDGNSGVAGLVQRTRAHGIVHGTREGGCALKNVKRTEDVQVGDLVVTSGLDGIFPKGLVIGKVTAVDKKGQGLFQNAEVVPGADLARLEEVLVPLDPVPVEEGPRTDAGRE